MGRALRWLAVAGLVAVVAAQPPLLRRVAREVAVNSALCVTGALVNVGDLARTMDRNADRLTPEAREINTQLFHDYRRLLSLRSQQMQYFRSEDPVPITALSSFDVMANSYVNNTECLAIQMGVVRGYRVLLPIIGEETR